LIKTLSLICNIGLAFLNAVVHVRPHAKSLKPKKPSHLNPWFKVIILQRHPRRVFYFLLPENT